MGKNGYGSKKWIDCFFKIYLFGIFPPLHLASQKLFTAHKRGGTDVWRTIRNFFNLGFIIWSQILWFECMIIGGKESISFSKKNRKHKWKPFEDNIECEKLDMFSLVIWINLDHLFKLLMSFSWSTGEGPNWTLILESTNTIWYIDLFMILHYNFT